MDEMNQCEVCERNRGFVNNTVDCEFNNRVMEIPTTHCAAQHLTIQGWVIAANKAENIEFDFVRGAAYRNRIIELRKLKT